MQLAGVAAQFDATEVEFETRIAADLAELALQLGQSRGIGHRHARLAQNQAQQVACARRIERPQGIETQTTAGAAAAKSARASASSSASASAARAAVRVSADSAAGNFRARAGRISLRSQLRV